MRKKGNTVTYTSDEVSSIIGRSDDLTNWSEVDAKTDEVLASEMSGDPDWQAIPGDWVSKAQKASGAPKQNKQLVSLRPDGDILEHFKAGGRGWQSRMNAALRSFVNAHR